MPMIRLGLTGGIGMGKSTAAELLAKRGAKVCDSDALARELVAPGQPALAEIVEAFGSGVLVRDGSLDRAKVGKLVFGDSAAREKLEGILHPRIRKVWQARLEHWLVAGERLAVTVIPLLFDALQITDTNPLRNIFSIKNRAIKAVDFVIDSRRTGLKVLEVLVN